MAGLDGGGALFVYGSMAARLRPESASMGRARSFHSNPARAHVRKAEKSVALVDRERAAGRARRGGGLADRHRRPGLGAILQFRQFRRPAATAAGRAAAARRRRLVWRRLLYPVPAA